MEKRVKVFEQQPEIYKALLAVEASLSKAGLPTILAELLKIRASQINGCAFCLDMHIKDALKAGELAKRIYVISAWREARQWFTAEEQAVLSLAEELTDISRQGLSSSAYNDAISLFGEAKTAALIVAASFINTWNRIAIATHMHP